MSELSILLVAILMGGGQAAAGKIPERAMAELKRAEAECLRLESEELQVQCLASRIEPLLAQPQRGLD